MQARTMILTVLVAGPLAGVLMGVAADPKMVPPREPAWRSARPDPIFAEPQRIVELGPQDLSPSWYVDRMPTWKRRAAEREAAASAASEYAEPPAPPPEIEPAEIEPAVFDAAAGAPAADRDAAADAEASAALVEAAPDPAL